MCSNKIRLPLFLPSNDSNISLQTAARSIRIRYIEYDRLQGCKKRLMEQKE